MLSRETIVALNAKNIGVSHALPGSICVECWRDAKFTVHSKYIFSYCSESHMWSHMINVLFDVSSERP